MQLFTSRSDGTYRVLNPAEVLLRYAIASFVFCILAAVITGQYGTRYIWILAGFFGIGLSYCGVLFYQYSRASRRLREHMRHAINKPAWLLQTPNNSLVNAYNVRYARTAYTTIALQAHAYTLYDLVVDVDRRTRAGDYVTQQFLHTIFEIPLRRQVPNIVFDDKKAHGRQFGRYLTNRQQVNAEALFNDRFNTYAPQGYHIDALSIASPEVLDAMLRFSIPADVEFSGNKLYCYAPLLAYEQLDVFVEQCLGLFKSVDDNLDTYRDDNLYGKDRITQVNGFARQLLRSPLARWRWLSLATAWLVGVSAWMVLGLSPHDRGQLFGSTVYWVYVVLPFSGELLWACKQYFVNRRALQRFRLSQQYVARHRGTYKTAVSRLR